jgi:hypothetical protein
LLTTNNLTVEYFDGNLGAYVNGKRVLGISIASIPVIGNYDIGLIQTSFSSDSSEVFYDDFNFSGCP